MFRSMTMCLLLAATQMRGGGCAPVGDSGAQGAKKLAGNAQRVERGIFEKGQGGGFGMEELFAYEDPTDATCYPNVFRMDGGRIVSITLRARISPSGNYTGDQVQIGDVTELRNALTWPIELSQSDYVSVINGRYQARVRRHGRDDYVYVTGGSKTAIVSVNDLYRWRVQRATQTKKIGDKEYKFMAQGGPKGAIVWFASKALIAALDPEAGRADLSPSFVVAVRGLDGPLLGDRPLGSSGYVIRVQQGFWDVVLAK